MIAHELLCKTNWELIQGRSFTGPEKNEIAGSLLSAARGGEEALPARSRASGHGDVRMMYPLFFVPPSNNGRKLITINGVMPKTQILSANHYELEILRLLALWRGEDAAIRGMLAQTRERLAATCFGRFCAKGECFEASIVVLRFLAAAFADEADWMRRVLAGIGPEIGKRPNGKKRHSGTTFYYWLTLADLGLPEALAEIERHKPSLVRTLSRSCSYGTEYDKRYNPIAMCIARNCLARLPEFHRVKELQGYAGSDGRYHMDFDAAAS